MPKPVVVLEPGAAHTRLKRAVATGDPIFATAAALELPRYC